MKKFYKWAAAIIVLLIVSLPVFYFRGEGGIHPGHAGRMKLPVGTNQPQICFGFSHGMILATDGSAWVWGESQLGFPAMGLGKIETQPSLRRLSNGDNWISVATCESHGLGVKTDGSLWAWGQNLGYQLGDGTRTTRNSPVHSAPGNDWMQVAAGAAHSMALKRNGTLWAWGNNWAGQLGINSLTNAIAPKQVGADTSWAHVWAGGIHTIAMRADGTLWHWGENVALPKQLFYNSKNLIVPTLLSAEINWTQISMWESMAIAVKSDGTLWACGRGANVFTGQTNQEAEATMHQIGMDSDWAQCATGRSYVLGLKKDNSLWAFDASRDQHTIQLKRINLSKDIIGIGAARGGIGGPWGSSGIGIALTRDGEVWTWGMAYGETKRNIAEDALVFVLKCFGKKTSATGRPNKTYDEPWQLGNVDNGGN